MNKKILHIIEDNLSDASGVVTVVKELNSQLLNKGFDSQIISMTSNMPESEFEHQLYFKKGVWRYTKTLSAQLEREIQSGNTIIHAHGVWSYPQHIANKLARKYKTPYLVTPHGMLEPWLFKSGGVKKRAYLKLLQNKHMVSSSVLHAITPQEKDHLWAMTSKQDIIVIPNLISIGFLKELKASAQEKKEKYILYLGRIDPKKGIDLLIQAFSRLNNKNIKLKIAGPFNPYMETLRDLVSELKLSERIEFLGRVDGTDKYNLYKNAHVFVAPSHSEVIGMVNLEAGLMATPVITTHQTGLLSEWNENGGVLINPHVDELYQSLSKAVSWSDSERDERGLKLKEFIIQNYSWEKNVSKWTDLYSQLYREL